MEFASQEWVEKYMELLNNNPAYEEAAKTWEGDFIFIIRDNDKNIRRELYLDLWHGKARRGWAITDFDNPGVEPEFIYDGIEKSWRGLLAKQIHPIQGLMTGKFKLTGSMPKVMRAVKAALELVETTTKIDCDFPDFS
ncbi:MAG: SCP2 sterol-binding domain-containing protein [Candidatus Hodarchaeota archaeon]